MLTCTSTKVTDSNEVRIKIFVLFWFTIFLNKIYDISQCMVQVDKQTLSRPIFNAGMHNKEYKLHTFVNLIILNIHMIIFYI